MSFRIFSLILLRGLLSAAEQLLFKQSTNSLEGQDFAGPLGYARFIGRILCMPKIWLGFLIIVVSWTVWFVVLASADLSLAAPAMSVEYIAILAVSYFLLKERVDRARLFGALLVLLGVLCVAVS